MSNLPPLPGFEPIAQSADTPEPRGIGDNNPPAPLIDLEYLQGLNAYELFKDGNIAIELKKIVDAANAAEFDPSTKEGREGITSLAYRVTRCRTTLDGKGKEVAELISGHRSTIKTTLNDVVDKIEKPKLEWETKEKVRKDALVAKVNEVKNSIIFLREPTVAEINARIDMLYGYNTSFNWQEFEDDCMSAVVMENLAALVHRRDNLLKAIADAKELAELRAKQAEEERKAAELAAQAAAVTIEPPKIDPVAHDKLVEELGLPDSFKAETVETPEPVATVFRDTPKPIETQAPTPKPEPVAVDLGAEMQRAKRGEAYFDLMRIPAVGLTDEQAKAIIIAIHLGKVRHVTINY